MTIIKLKRARNSLVDVSKLPPELLGDIFCRVVAPGDEFDGLEVGTYRFLLVCHHWFEVASHSQELWAFWGNNLADWRRCCRRPGRAPLDLTLCRESDHDFDAALSNALQDRASQDTIRRVHLLCDSSELLTSILSSLTPEREGIQPSSLQSFALLGNPIRPVDVSNFFARHRFPKLRHLELSKFVTSSWDNLGLRTGALTQLRLTPHDAFPDPPTNPTTSQLLSILASNLNLQEVSLFNLTALHDGGGTTSFQVKLHHLEQLRLDGTLPAVSRLLRHLDPPILDKLVLSLNDCSIADFSHVGRYIREYFQLRGRPPTGLAILPPSRGCFSLRSRTVIYARDIGRTTPTFFKVEIHPNDTAIESGLLGMAALELSACVPRQGVTWVEVQGVDVTIWDSAPGFRI